MEEMSQAVLVPFRLGNSICDNPKVETCMSITRLKLMANTTSLFLDSGNKNSGMYVSNGDEHCNYGDSEGEGVKAVSMPGEKKSGGAVLLHMTSENESNWVASDAIIQDSEEYDFLSLEGDQILDSSCSLSVPSGTSSVCGDNLFSFETASEIGTPSSHDIDNSICNVEVIAKDMGLEELNIEGEIVNDSIAVAVSLGEENQDVSNSKSSAVALQLPLEKGLSGTVGRSVFEVDYAPLWAFQSIRGRRPEMEDAAATVPRFLQIPIQMLIGDRPVDGMKMCLSHLTTHFFGIYDGHGSSQVANYCRDRLHSALAEELEIVMAGLHDGITKDNCQEQWRKVFTNCFLKVDAEIGGKASLEPIAPETVGTTAVVAIICSSHIIVANSGDSRAVLCRGKEPMALSVDHKPNREDEYA